MSALKYWDGAAWVTVGGGGSGSSMVKTITQTSHGFTVGDVLRLSGSTYVEAKADVAANAEVAGIVSTVPDANTFTLLVGGALTGLSGLTAGGVYFLSNVTAGALTATEPSIVGAVSKPLLVADSTTSGYFYNFRGSVISNVAAAAPATLQTATLTPTGTTSTTAVMCGMAGLITPVRSGKIHVTISGYLYTSAVATSITVGIKYGGGAAPANGAANVGAGVGSFTVLSEASATYRYPFSLSGVITGLTIGTQIWLDLFQQVNGTTTGNVVCSITAFELP